MNTKISTAQEPDAAKPIEKIIETPVFLQLAFRPLFFLGAVFSCVSLGVWALFLNGHFQLPTYTTPFLWHGHEMLFGFVAAIVVGFLLTAVQNWTGIKGLNGKPLLLLITVWFAARVSFLIDVTTIPLQWIDLLFIPLSAYFLARPIIAIKQTRNLMFVPVLTLMFLSNLGFHYGIYSNDLALSQQALQAMLWLTVLLITLLGGRVIPFFTANGTQKPRASDQLWLDISVIASTAMVVVVQGFGLSNMFSPSLNAALLLTAAILQGTRFCRWKFWNTSKVALLWSLHGAYAFVPLGMALLAASYTIDNLSYSTAQHAILTGAIGAMILSMMARVSLGHSGRPLKPKKIMSVAFSLILATGLIRSLGVWLGIESSLIMLTLAAAGWILAYGIFAWVYWPVLSKPRIDGKPG